MDRRTAFIALSLVPSLQPVEAARLIAHSRNEPERLFSAGEEELRQAGGLDPKTARALLDSGLPGQAREEEKLAARRGWRILTPAEAEYPQGLLGQIHDPPPALFVDGRPEALAVAGVAVVGSRRASPYGRSVARTLARDLAARGAAVFSGLARGIDSAAHKGALEAGGVTVAVLGCGLDVSYPRENAPLAEEIRRGGGALVSEMPAGAQPLPRHFPRRNRIISGLSWGVVVVEADERSGSLITARLGMEQGREIFAVPGNITSPTSRGANLLIRGGAKLVTEARDVLEELPPPARQAMEKAAAARPTLEGGEEDGAAAAARLEGTAAEIYRRLRVDQPLGLAELAEAVSLATHELHPHLIRLELEGLARLLPGGRYLRRD